MFTQISRMYIQFLRRHYSSDAYCMPHTLHLKAVKSLAKSRFKLWMLLCHCAGFLVAHHLVLFSCLGWFFFFFDIANNYSSEYKMYIYENISSCANVNQNKLQNHETNLNVMQLPSADSHCQQLKDTQDALSTCPC